MMHQTSHSSCVIFLPPVNKTLKYLAQLLKSGQELKPDPLLSILETIPTYSGKVKPTGSDFAGKGKVVITRHIIPLSTLMPHCHHTVLPRVEVVIGLVGPPVYKCLRKSQNNRSYRKKIDYRNIDCYQRI